MHPAELETLVDRELKRLPVPRAPRTLLPRVLAAVQQWSRRPWYARAWLTWPLGWQLVSSVALMLIIVGSVIALPSARAAAGGATSPFAAGVMSHVTGIWERAAVTLHASRIIWRATVEPLVVYLFALVALMCVACAAFGTALTRVALGRI